MQIRRNNKDQYMVFDSMPIIQMDTQSFAEALRNSKVCGHRLTDEQIKAKSKEI